MNSNEMVPELEGQTCEERLEEMNISTLEERREREGKEEGKRRERSDLIPIYKLKWNGSNRYEYTIKGRSCLYKRPQEEIKKREHA